MSTREMLKNEVRLVGTLEREFEFYYSKNMGGTQVNYYINYIIIEREQKENEHIPIVMPEKLINFFEEYKNKKVEIFGKLKETNFKKSCFLYVLVKEMIFLKANRENQIMDHVIIECKMHKISACRKYKSGRRRVDFKIKIDEKMIITAVAWNREATYISKVEKGDRLKLVGRIITRHYKKGEEIIETNELEVTDVQIQK